MTDGPQIPTDARQDMTDAPQIRTYARQIATDAPQITTYAPQIPTYAPHTSTDAPQLPTYHQPIAPSARKRATRAPSRPHHGAVSPRNRTSIRSVPKPDPTPPPRNRHGTCVTITGSGPTASVYCPATATPSFVVPSSRVSRTAPVSGTLRRNGFMPATPPHTMNACLLP